MATNDEERRVAEDYRRQRQASEAQKNGVPPIQPERHVQWLLDNPQVLEQAAKAGGATEDELPGFIQEYKDSIATIALASEYDDPHALHIMARVLREIEEICRKNEIPIKNGMVFGVTPTPLLIATQMPVLTTDASILGLSLPFFVFCNAIAKAMAKTLVYFQHENRVAVDNRPDSIRRKLDEEPYIIQIWVDIFRDFGGNVWPINFIEPSLGKEEGTIRTLLLQAVELFSIGHEYGHHVLAHGLVDSTAVEEDAFDQEHGADIFGQTMCMLGAIDKPMYDVYAMSGVGAVLILGSLDLVRRASAVLRTGADIAPPREHHPPFRDRIDYIGRLDAIAPEVIRPELATRRSAFCEILEMIWVEVRPHILKLHHEGMRPTGSTSDLDDRLPLF